MNANPRNAYWVITSTTTYVCACVNHSYARLTSTGILTPANANASIKIAHQASSGAPTNVNAFATFRIVTTAFSGALIPANANACPKTVSLTSSGTKIFASACVWTNNVREVKSGLRPIANVAALQFRCAQLDFCGMTIFADASARKLYAAQKTSTGTQSTADACASTAVLTASLLTSGTQSTASVSLM